MTEATAMTKERCEQDHALWAEEIEAWKKDHARALHTLEEATRFILRHEEELEEHTREIEEHQRAKNVSAPDRIETIREQHLKVQHRHNVFRGRHRGLIEEVMRLQVALHKASHGKPF